MKVIIWQKQRLHRRKKDFQGFVKELGNHMTQNFLFL
jgi:hypothetical protein